MIFKKNALGGIENDSEKTRRTIESDMPRANKRNASARYHKNRVMCVLARGNNDSPSEAGVIEMLNKNDSLFYINTGRNELEIVAISLFNEKIEFVLSRLLEKSKAGAIESKLDSGVFYKICAGAGFNRKQGRRVLLFLIKTGKIRNRGKKGLEIVC